MLKVLLIGFLLLSKWLPAFSQLQTDRSAGELVSLVSVSKPDSNRVGLLLNLAFYYYFDRDTRKRNLDSFSFYLQQAKGLGDHLHSTTWEPEIFCYLGKYATETGDTILAGNYLTAVGAAIKSGRSIDQQLQRWKDLAWNIACLDSVALTRIDCFKRMAALYHQTNNPQQEIEQEKQIADTHMKQGFFELADSELLDVVRKFKAIGFRDLHYTYQLLYESNHQKGDYNKALYYALLAVESMQKPAVPVSASYTIMFYSALARLYEELGRTDKSIDNYRLIFSSSPPNPYDFYMYREAGDFVRELVKGNKEHEAKAFLDTFSVNHPPHDRYAQASLVRTFAWFYSAIGENDLSESYSRRLVVLGKYLGKDNEIRGDVEFDIGQYYLNKKQFANAATHFNIARDEAVYDHSLHTRKDVELMLFKTDSSAGNYASAIGHLNLYQEFKDSIFNVARIKQIEEVQGKYELEKKQQNIQLLEKGNLLQKSELKRAAYTRNWILVGVILLLVIMVLLINNSLHKQRTNKILEAQRNDLRHLLEEKEWLVKEIHHRVKNNLQMIAGLLDGQAGFLASGEAVTAIRESQFRVNAMSLVHQKLYQTANLSNTDMVTYISELVAYLELCFDSSKHIRFILRVERIQLGLSHSIPLGLILNEAITNAIKYGFPKGRHGEITIRLQRNKDNRFLLSVEDNGVGISLDGEKQLTGSMGMNLMKGLSDDISGNFTIENDDGTKVRISFPGSNPVVV